MNFYFSKVHNISMYYIYLKVIYQYVKILFTQVFSKEKKYFL